MKIYCNNVPYNFLAEKVEFFDQFLGQYDLWVKCWYQISTRVVWVRFLKKTTESWNDGTVHTTYYVNALSEHSLDNKRKHPEWRIDLPKLGLQTEAYDIKYLQVITPVETATTSELFDVALSDTSLLDELAGTGYWVKAYYIVDGRDYYISVDEKQGKTVTCYAIDASYIDDYEYEDTGDYDLPSDEVFNKTYHVDALNVYGTDTILTGEEFDELLAESDRIFNEGWNEAYIDYDRGDYEDEDY